MNRTELKQRVALVSGRSDVLTVLAELLGRSVESVCMKMNGKTQFTAREINAIRTTYGLTDRECVGWLIEKN